MSVGKSFSSAICRILQDVPLAKRRCQEVLGRRSSPTWRPAHAPFKLWRVPTTRDDLLAWVHAHGLAALDELFGAEAVALAGPKGRHQPQRSHHHWGTAATELTFGGRRVQVRPRVRQTIG